MGGNDCTASSSPSNSPRKACRSAGKRASSPSARTFPPLIYALGFANRAALSFGGVKPGDFDAQPALQQGPHLRVRAGAAARWTPRSTPPPPGPSTTASRSSPTPTSRRSCPPASAPTSTSSPTCRTRPWSRRALEVRGCKIKIDQSPHPRPVRPGLRGRAHPQAGHARRVRRQPHHRLRVRHHASTWTRSTTAQIDIIGPDIDHRPARHGACRWPSGSRSPAARCSPTSSPILERQIHHLLNGAEGIWHMGQRDIIWTRVSKAGFAKGLRLRHYGEILHAKLLSEYPRHRRQGEGHPHHRRSRSRRTARRHARRKVYDERNRRLGSHDR